MILHSFMGIFLDFIPSISFHFLVVTEFYWVSFRSHVSFVSIGFYWFFFQFDFNVFFFNRGLSSFPLFFDFLFALFFKFFFLFLFFSLLPGPTVSDGRSETKHQRRGVRKWRGDHPEPSNASMKLETHTHRHSHTHTHCGFTGFYWVLPSFTEFYWVLMGFIRFYWIL